MKRVLIHEMVGRQVQETPDAIAIQHGDESLSYKELNQRAGELAEAILAASPDAPLVGISTTRSVDMIVGVLAILRSGKAYLPLDPGYPAGRLQEIISDAGIDRCLCAESEKTLLEGFGIQTHSYRDTGKAYPKTGIPPVQGLAYVLYTSGSTGKPKGVCMGHAALVNLLDWQKKDSAATVGTRTLQFAPLSFDVSFQEIFATLTTGGTLVMIDDDLRLDPQQLLRFILDGSINRLFVPFVALQYLTEAAEAIRVFPASLTEIVTAGEQLKITRQVRGFFTALPDCSLVNQYGPTECHVVSSLTLTGTPANWPDLPSIGKPVSQVHIYILGERDILLPDGETGELCISGICLAEGYLNRPVLTAEKFMNWQHPQKGTVRIYRTGDLANYDPAGNIEFLGRKDQQVKIRGHRVEPGEIEVLLNAQTGIQQAVVVAAADASGQLRLVAYLLSSDSEKNTAALRKSIGAQLPDYMMPAVFVWMDSLPKTSSGKIDRQALPQPDIRRPDLPVLYKAPSTKMETAIAGIWMGLLQYDRIGVDDNFFELGGNSLLAVKTVSGLQLSHQVQLPITKLYQHPTIAGIAGYLEGTKHTAKEKRKQRSEIGQHDPVAVISMAARFPGSATIPAFWDILREGKETISFFTKEELDPALSETLVSDPEYVRARGVLDDPAAFDAAFFGIQPKLAQLMDPQQRIFLEIAWEALEKTGYIPSKYDGRVGVFAGVGNNSYYLNNVLSNKEMVERVGAFQVMTYNEKDYVASRTAYALDLKGPAVSIHSACSTSLLAIAEAVESLRSGQCDIALAGGAAVTVPVKSGHLYQEGAMLSRDGHCRSFDARGEGTVFSDGAGIVLLKTLEAAEKDGDEILAIIRGVGINNDGAGKGSFSAPSAEGQAGAVSMALEDADVDPASISYVEAHGTATPVGDPIEIEGLNIAFGKQDQKQYCAVGSVKSNMGHLTAAAGVAGLIKTVLAMQHRQIPRSVHFEKPNPNIDFANSPFFVNAALRPWETAGPRRAGVSSFGVGGTNVHVVLEEYPRSEKKSGPGRPLQLISWSAKTNSSREAFAGTLAAFVAANPSLNLADLAYTLSDRADFRSRRFVLASGAEELIARLRADTVSPTESKLLEENAGELLFIFPGQGSQQVNMGLELYRHEIVFKEAVDRCAVFLEPLLQDDIRTLIYPDHPGEEASARINDTFYTQPALFVIEYALAQLWMSWGIRPAAFIGHSIGEFVAAHLAGVFSLEDGLKLIATRGRLMRALPRGSMLSVRANHQELLSSLPKELSLAAVNSPALCVVSGEDKFIDIFSAFLEGRGISNKKLHTSHAFHSAMMDPIVKPFEQVVRSVTLRVPRTPVISTVTGKWMTDENATDPAYWAAHLRSTVQFSAAIVFALEQQYGLMLEAGPGTVGSVLARQQGRPKVPVAISSLDPAAGPSAYHSILRAAGQLWLQGVAVDQKAFYGNQQRVKIALPAYAFDRTRYWVEPATSVPVLRPSLPSAGTAESKIIPIENNKMRTELLIDRIKEILENASGIEMENVTPEMGFIEMGLDSLLLTQVTLNLKKEFGIPVTFRQLNEEYGSLRSLATYLDQQLPADRYRPQTAGSLDVAKAGPVPETNEGAMLLITQQIQLLAQQVALLQNGSAPLQKISPPSPEIKKTVTAEGLSADELAELKKPFGATAKIERQATALSEKQQAFLDALTLRYNKKTAGSKQYAQKHRSYMSDPRVVSGFKPLTKEIIYPLVVNHSSGSHLWDIDGNEYIDALNGFGSNLLGYQPEIITRALKNQIDKGYELGPQHELAGEVCKLIVEFTGLERAALCNTGSEAVLGAMRIARTVTGRSLIVAFSGSYHGINDEVIVRGTRKLKTFPAAPGIMPEAVQNMLILDYGTPGSLEIIRSRAQELAAVLVEPVQSRRPEFQPVEFLRELRAITAASGTALIFDEVITGFRMHPAGAQGLFGIQADLGTYGKVIAGGMPIGVIAGTKLYMDALDGGFWQYGDQSGPEAGVTYFAGTFVRHPLALAATRATLGYMREKGPRLQQDLTDKTKRLADKLNEICSRKGLPLYIAQFGSLWKVKFKEELSYSELLFTLLREKGVHIWDGFPCFLSAAHTDSDVDFVISKFRESADELADAGFFPGLAAGTKAMLNMDEHPPVEGARLGKDRDGNPAWFIADPVRPGKYLQVK
jgi:amino acid adenylation domain-containing protein